VGQVYKKIIKILYGRNL